MTTATATSPAPTPATTSPTPTSTSTPSNPWKSVQHSKPHAFEAILLQQDHERKLNQEPQPGTEEWEEYQLALALQASLQTAQDEAYDDDEAFARALSEQLNQGTESASGSVRLQVDDELIAQQLQSEYDQEHDRRLRMREQQFNANSKVTMSYENYKLSATLDDEDEPCDAEDDYDELADAYELNKNDTKALGSSSKIVTKHDMLRGSRKNAKMMETFPMHFNSGNTVDDTSLRISNTIYNSLKQHSMKNPHGSSRNKLKLHDKDDVSTQERVLDPRTGLMLMKMVDKNILDSVSGIISTGKEANVYQGMFVVKTISDEPYHTPSASEQLRNEQESSSSVEPEIIPCALKIFKTTLNEFKNREMYIVGDVRYKGKINRRNPRRFIKTWAEKEKDNLRRLRATGISCPRVLKLKDHILILSLIADDEGRPAPQLQSIYSNLSLTRLETLYHDCIHILQRLYQQSGLVHADFSPYNLLYAQGQLHVIDVSQAVETVHPQAHAFLFRDCQTTVEFFGKAGVSTVATPLQLFLSIIGATDLEVGVQEALQREIDSVGSTKLLPQPVIDNILRYKRFVLPDMPTSKLSDDSLDSMDSSESTDEVDDE